MKFTLSWLRDHLDFDAPLETLTDTLTRIGLEVDGVENPADRLAAFTIAEVVAAKPHPDADKLKVCTVNTGSETVQVVCGAPNARAGMKAVLGRPGTYVPGIDMTLKKAKIRGVDSVGMMCSARELELGEDHDGILDLPADAPVGEVYASWAGLDDPVIDIDITPNRQDCLGVYGIARDLAAAGLGTLRPLAEPHVDGAFDALTTVARTLPEEAADACPYFVARDFRGLANGESPAWMQDRLTAIGLRPISALVDITNYISIDLGRPLHIFDRAKLTGDLTVRLAEAGESFLALDGKTYTAEGGETVIADEAGIQAFGGVIGAEATGCDEATTDAVLEVALFDPVRTAMTGRRHGIITDARYRFERGVDPQFVDRGVHIASEMILRLCGGQASVPASAGHPPRFEHSVSFRPERIATLGGLDVPAGKTLAILESLGFQVSGDGPLTVQVPSWRRDIVGEPDLVEEVLRIVGLDSVPVAALPPRTHSMGSTLSPAQKRARTARRALAGIGFNEAVTWSFLARDHARLFGGGDDSLCLDNPISSDLDCMRPSILPGLALAAQRNRDRGADAVRLAEVGPAYVSALEDGQELHASGLRAGVTAGRHWRTESRAVDVFDAKADALSVLAAVGAPVDSLQVFPHDSADPAMGAYHPGRSGTLRLGPKTVLARFGEIHPAALKALDVEGPLAAFEVLLDRLPRPRKGIGRGALNVSNLQSVRRDFAFVVDEGVPVADLVRAARGADKAAISAVDVFDVYQGKGVPEGQKSVALSVTLTPTGQTFSEAGIEAIAGRIQAAAHKTTGATLRG
ncbi:phenylalanine--tRNA ligase subunit beta [Yunchengibacter salinarum]|uniref:phenylalanine--tRNA ligase subunit beta n=1 Tax=Yunchengibacter salinarum TaxID=3133399 RepID=UPI0035B65DF3